MTGCPRTQDLLEAELDTLAGEADGPLGRHVASCARCRAAAAEILSATRAMAAALDQAVGDGRVADASAGHTFPAEGRGARSTGPARPPGFLRWGATGSSRHARPPRPVLWTGLLVAAALAFLLLVPEREPALPGELLERSAPLLQVVEAPPGRNVAVIATDDPDIIVLWFFEGASR